jgi:hypothetical protein
MRRVRRSWLDTPPSSRPCCNDPKGKGGGQPGTVQRESSPATLRHDWRNLSGRISHPVTPIVLLFSLAFLVSDGAAAPPPLGKRAPGKGRAVRVYP